MINNYFEIGHDKKKKEFKLILEDEYELVEIFEFSNLRNFFNKSYDLKFYDTKNKIIRRFKIKEKNKNE